MIFILKDLKAKTIITFFDKTFNIVRKSKSLINAINDFVLFRRFKVLCFEKIMYKNEDIKTQIVVVENKKSIIVINDCKRL